MYGVEDMATPYDNVQKAEVVCRKNFSLRALIARNFFAVLGPIRTDLKIGHYNSPPQEILGPFGTGVKRSGEFAGSRAHVRPFALASSSTQTARVPQAEKADPSLRSG
jgi:hypothetical protein